MRNYVLQTGAFALAIGHYAQGLQLAVQASLDSGDPELEPKRLDKKEVEERGSHCLDGSAPYYHHKIGSETHNTKWVIWLNPGFACSTPEACADKLPVHKDNNSKYSMPLQKHDEFKDYHHVVIDNCDLGLYMGNVDEPIDYNSTTKLYFQGSRIIKHVIDVLDAAYGPMTDVLISGGSGGGQSLFVGADYIQSFMPKSVTRFGIAPINGYGQGSWDDEMKDAYSLHRMGDHTPASCKQANSEPYNCIKPVQAYKYSEPNMFLVQVFDHTFEWIRKEMLKTWENCMGSRHAPTGSCKDEDAQTLSRYWVELVANVSHTQKSKRPGQGGFLSTCSTHNFYQYFDMFKAYAIDGISVGDAIASWWQKLNSPSSPPQWHLPCTLGSTVQELQCEPSCDIMKPRPFHKRWASSS